MESIKKIVTHLPPNHLDDTLAVSLLLNLFKNADIEFLSYDDKILEEYKKDKKIVLVDIGLIYDEKLNNFDHHQDLNLNCSFLLVLKKFFPKYYKLLPEMQIYSQIKFIDLKDRFGIKIAQKETKLKSLFLLEMIINNLSVSSLEEVGKNLIYLFETEIKNLQNKNKIEIINFLNKKIVLNFYKIKPSLLFKLYDIDIIISKHLKNKNKSFLHFKNKIDYNFLKHIGIYDKITYQKENFCVINLSFQTLCKLFI